MNVSFICDSLVGCQGYNPECRWLDVMRSCILRKEELNSLLADGNQIMPYTTFELEVNIVALFCLILKTQNLRQTCWCAMSI